VECSCRRNLQSGAGTNSITVLWTTTGLKTISVNYSIPRIALHLPHQPIISTSLRSGTYPHGPDEYRKGIPAVYTTEAGMSNYSWVVSPADNHFRRYTTDATITISWNNPGTETVSINYTAGTGAPLPHPWFSPFPSSPVQSLPMQETPLFVRVETPASRCNQPGRFLFSWTASGSSRM